MSKLIKLVAILLVLSNSIYGQDTSSDEAVKLLLDQTCIELKNLFNNPNPDRNSMIGLSEVIINNCGSECQEKNENIITYAYFAKAVYEQNLDQKKQWCDKIIANMTTRRDGKIDEIIFKTLYIRSQLCDPLDCKCTQDLFKKSKTIYDVIKHPSDFVRNDYYWMMVNSNTCTLNSGKEFDERDYSEILNLTDTLFIQQKIVMLSILGDYLYGNIEYYKTLVNYSDQIITQLENNCQNDNQIRMLAKAYRNLNDPIVLKSIVSKIDSMNILRSIDTFKSINALTKQDTMEIIYQYQSLAIIYMDKFDFEGKIHIWNTILSYINNNWIYKDLDLTIQYYKAIETLTRFYSNVGENEKSQLLYDNLYKEYLLANKSNLIPNYMLDKLDIHLNNMLLLVNKESYIINSEDSKITALNLRKTAEAYNSLGLKEQATLAYQNLIEHYDNSSLILNRDDSTNLVAAYAHLAKEYDDFYWDYKSLSYIPKNVNRSDHFVIGLSSILFKHDKLNNRDSVDSVMNRMTKYCMQHNCINTEAYYQTRLYYLQISHLDDEVINLTEELIRKWGNVKNISSFEFRTIQSYAGSLLFKGRMRDGINILLKMSLDLKDKSYETNLYSTNYLLSNLYLYENIDSSKYYWKEMISSNNLIINESSITNSNSSIKQLDKIRIAEKYFHNNSLIPFVTANDTLYMKAGKSTGVNLTSLKLLGENDLYLELLDQGSSVKVKIYNQTGLQDELVLNYNHADISTPTAFNTNWNKIEPLIKGHKNLYIKTSGNFDFMNFSCFVSPDTKMAINKTYNIFRIKDIHSLNSYYQLGLLKSDVSSLNVELIGAPNFGGKNTNVVQFGANLRSINNLGNWTYLDGAKAELDAITKTLREYEYTVNLTTDAAANEEYVLGLQSPDVLHIATHGYIDAKDDSTSYGLVLANANISSDDISNDGYLYSSDIGNIDLADTKLVVLSSCESGLYKENDDNSFIKSFFNAGVDHILVTLWKIDDDATKDLMVNFYTNLVQTRDIKYSYDLAQNFMREKYKDPFYWGSFILISNDMDYGF